VKKYYLLLDKYIALEEDRNPTLFLINGNWEFNADLLHHLHDAMMDYGDYSLGDYEPLTFEQAKEFCKKNYNYELKA
jgi:hypothetical protein